MSWTDRFARGAFTLFSGNVIEAFQPLDFFHFNPLWYPLWFLRVVEALEKLGAEQKSYAELKSLLPPPSNLRALLVKVVPAYREPANLETFARVANFLARMLEESCPDDPYAEKSNPCHRPDEVERIVKETAWQPASPQIGRTIGQLITAAGSLVHGLYNDVVTDLGWDAFGPYDVRHDGRQMTLLLRVFPNLRPKELWLDSFLLSVRGIDIRTLYEGVEWEIRCVGCHTVATRGNPVQGMRAWAVLMERQPVDADRIQALIAECSAKAEHIYRTLRAMDFEALKEKVQLQECYQLKKLFDAAGVDWRPTPPMLSAIRGKPLLTGIVPHGKMVTSLAEFKDFLRINQFAREVLGEQ